MIHSAYWFSVIELKIYANWLNIELLQWINIAYEVLRSPTVLLLVSHKKILKLKMIFYSKTIELCE